MNLFNYRIPNLKLKKRRQHIGAKRFVNYYTENKIKTKEMLQNIISELSKVTSLR